MIVAGIFEFLTGVGILLFGVEFMGKSCEKLFGVNFRKSMNKYASNRWGGFGFGTLLTFAIQSSTATTAMFSTFAGAGIITLYQSIGLIMGCNVGTALSNFILALDSLKLVEVMASFVLVGVLVNTFGKKNDKAKNIGNVLIGFGILFAGLILISGGTAVFKTIDGFEAILTKFTDPFLLIVVGTLATVLLQSSFGTIAIIISLMATTGVGGILPISACYLVYGTNIGTTFTTVIASLSTNTDGKRVAWFHVLFNVIGTILMTILTLTIPWVNWLSSKMSGLIFVLVVNTIFNVLTSLVLMPFVSPLSKLMTKLVRISKKERNSDYLLQTSDIEIPTIAVKKLNYQIFKLTESNIENFKLLKEFCIENEVKNPKKLKLKLKEIEENANTIYSNTLKISGLISDTDKRNVYFIQHSVESFKEIKQSYEQIINKMVVEDKKTVILKRRKKMLEDLFGKITKVMIFVKEIYENLYKENLHYDCEKTVKEIIEITDEISAFKTNDKKLMAYSIRLDASLNYTNIMNILNELSDMKNNLVDIALNMVGFFNVSPKHEEQEAKQEDNPVNTQENSKQIIVETGDFEQHKISKEQITMSFESKENIKTKNNDKND